MVQIIVINSINRSSGKSLLAAHLAVMLAKDYKVVVMDDYAKSNLSDFVAKRYALNLGKDFNLAVPVYRSLNKENFSQADKYDVVILDSPSDKYFAYADVFITPLRGQEGLNSLVLRNSLYASLVWEAKKQRAAKGKNAFKWVVIPNDDTFLQEDYDKLNEAGKFLGFLVAPKIGYRKEFELGLEQGISVLDKDSPKLKTLFDLPDLYARRDLKKITDFIWQNK